MNDHIAVIEHDPSPLFVALHAATRVEHLLLHKQLNLVGHGVQLPPAAASRDHEIIEHRRKTAEIEDVHVGAPRLLGHPRRSECAGMG